MVSAVVIIICIMDLFFKSSMSVYYYQFKCFRRCSDALFACVCVCACVRACVCVCVLINEPLVVKTSHFTATRWAEKFTAV